MVLLNLGGVHTVYKVEGNEGSTMSNDRIIAWTNTPPVNIPLIDLGQIRMSWTD